MNAKRKWWYWSYQVEEQANARCQTVPQCLLLSASVELSSDAWCHTMEDPMYLSILYDKYDPIKQTKKEEKKIQYLENNIFQKEDKEQEHQ